MKKIPALFLYSLIAAQIAQAAYEVRSGDTLSQIAESHYGDWGKWRNIWDLNKQRVADPDLIYPGQRLQLLTDEELQFFTANNTNPGQRSDAGEGLVRMRSSRGLSQEWRMLPKQKWEEFIFRKSALIDPDGFDRRSKVAKRVADKTAADVTLAMDRLPIYGEIVHARTEYERVFLGQQVFIRADEQLQVGTTYSLTNGPQKMVSKRDGRVGFAYDLTGKVKIVGVRDGQFIGTLTALFHPVLRHQLLIPEVKDYTFTKAIAAPTAARGILLATKEDQHDMLSEQKIVFVDLGVSDGIQAGMIFRSYLHEDPGTGEKISTKDFVIESELQILQALDKFSVGIILKSHSIAHVGDEIIALTDLKDFERNQGLQSVLQDGLPSTSNVDDLDQMDSTDGLGEKENRDLRQLEKWSKPAPDTAAIPETSASDEVQKVDPHGSGERAAEIGQESAPDDGSANRPTTAPVPENSQPSAEPNAAPAPVQDSLGPSLDQTPALVPEQTPIQETNPLPTADPFAP